MNDLASALSTALHEEAKEIAMSADIQHAERQLQASMRSVDRRRRVWMAVAAAALLVVAAGVALAIKLPKNEPAKPPPQVQLTKPILFSQIEPPALTVRLPSWTAHPGAASHFGAGEWYGGTTNAGRGLGLFSVEYMYPLGATTISHPSYDALVADWEAVQAKGYGTVTDVSSTRVGGKPATTMTVRLTAGSPGFVYCETEFTPRTSADSCQPVTSGRLLHLAIVNQGTNPPTLLWESESTRTPDTTDPSVTDEFNAWLATVHFG
jgi:hypothetical protein